MAEATTPPSSAKKPTTAKKPAAKSAARKPATKKTVNGSAKPKPRATAAKPAGTVARARFSAAIEEARSGAAALAKDVQDRSGAYREKLTSTGNDWIEEAKVMGDQARVRAGELAKDGKSRASDAISGLGKVVADNASSIDDRLGTRYGDYARTASRSMQEAAAKLEAKDLNELGDDARQMVRKSPGLAIGIAAMVGFLFARMFRGGSSDD